MLNRLFSKPSQNHGTPLVVDPNGNLILLQNDLSGLLFHWLQPRDKIALSITCKLAKHQFNRYLHNPYALFASINNMTPTELEAFHAALQKNADFVRFLDEILDGTRKCETPKAYLCAAILCDSIVKVDSVKLMQAWADIQDEVSPHITKTVHFIRRYHEIWKAYNLYCIDPHHPYLVTTYSKVRGANHPFNTHLTPMIETLLRAMLQNDFYYNTLRADFSFLCYYHFNTYSEALPHLRGIKLKGAIFHNVSIRDMDLTGADFSGCEFYGLSSLEGSNLTNANFTGALMEVETRNVQWESCVLRNAKIPSINKLHCTGRPPFISSLDRIDARLDELTGVSIIYSFQQLTESRSLTHNIANQIYNLIRNEINSNRMNNSDAVILLQRVCKHKLFTHATQVAYTFPLFGNSQQILIPDLDGLIKLEEFLQLITVDVRNDDSAVLLKK